MRKLGIWICIVTIFSLTGCGGTDTANSGGPETPGTDNLSLAGEELSCWGRGDCECTALTVAGEAACKHDHYKLKCDWVGVYSCSHWWDKIRGCDVPVGECVRR